MVLDPIHYTFLGVAAFATMIWTLVSMGVIRLRDHGLYVERERYIEDAKTKIEETFHIMEHIPAVNHSGVKEHLDNGEINKALEMAKIQHDVFHFFKNY